ncbi:late competence protein ComER [Cohnella hashimotonis]|uniref:Pyrroline-5-carboxylate reductase n=1 Tax=Cohnella hashimotonis TaxID=2826895 RepID=A0ABT6TKB9_9BACL|nr:late competence protein ComER [Cohnella hashimotonis]MDI4646703.1 late competence protein ComER [Cohnella hashimotonis]
MKVGFIGAGSMGGLLAGALLRARAFEPSEVTIATRTSSKAERLAQQFPGLRIGPTNASAVRDADIVFLCVKPLDYRAVIGEIRESLRPEQLLVSITSPVTLEQLERLLPCKTAKIVPSIVNGAASGASLFMYGTRLEPADKKLLISMFARISEPIEVPEDSVRAASDLSSCGPAFMAYLLEQFVETTVEFGGLAPEVAARVGAEMMLGTARLLEQGCTTRELQERVCVPGGITAVAMEELRLATKDAFRKVMRKTHDKFAEDLAKVEASLSEQSFSSD